MAKEKIIKTNAIRMLDKAKVPYIHRCWEQATGQHTGVELAQALGQDPAQVFKTLVTVAKSGEHYVFLVPVAEELDLKKAAAAGMVALFCGVTNCPITSMLISFELFGFAGVSYYLIAISISYALSGYYSLYKDQTIVYSKYKAKYINRKTR